MNHDKIPTIATAAFAMLLGASSLAAADFYLGAGLGDGVEGGSFRTGLERFTDSGGDPWKVFAGLQVGRHLGFEVSRYDFGTQRCCEQVADIGFHSSVDGFSAAVLGRWPLGRRFVPFAKAGILAWEEEGEFVTLIGPTARSDDGTDLLLGAGFDFEIVERLALRAEAERYEFEDASSEALWASLLFRF